MHPSPHIRHHSTSNHIQHMSMFTELISLTRILSLNWHWKLQLAIRFILHSYSAGVCLLCGNQHFVFFVFIFFFFYFVWIVLVKVTLFLIANFIFFSWLFALPLLFVNCKQFNMVYTTMVCCLNKNFIVQISGKMYCFWHFFTFQLFHFFSFDLTFIYHSFMLWFQIQNFKKYISSTGLVFVIVLISINHTIRFSYFIFIYFNYEHFDWVFETHVLP